VLSTIGRMSILQVNRRFDLVDVLLYAIGVAGLAMCLTLVFMSMRAVMDVGGFCAEGGPYVVETHCPEGVPLLLTGGIFGLFLFGGMMAWKGSVIGGPYAGLVALAWPVLFLSLGWNFLEYAFNPPGPPGQGIVWGWLIPGVLFILMGGLPLLAVLPIGNTGRPGAARERLATRVAPRGPRSSPTQADYQRLADDLRAVEDRTQDAQDLVSKLERLAALRESGDLSREEFEQAKRVLLVEVQST
jgi:hypothetical protein